MSHSTFTTRTVLDRPRGCRGLAVLALLALAGCGQQVQVEGENRELIIALATAVSSQNPQWLDENARQIDQKHKAGALSDAQHASFSRIIAQARGGDWDAAQRAVYALRDGQQPTSADLQNLEKRKLAPHHGMKPGQMPKGEG
jgi:hypothetical protein